MYGAAITAYEYAGRAFVADTYGADGYSTSTFSNISTATSGFIGADPIVVGFQEQDLLSFPVDYVSSMAKRYNRTWTAATTTSNAPTAASTPSLPVQTSPPSTPADNAGLSTGAKAGIGVGITTSAVVIAAIGALVLYRRRKSRKANEPHESEPIPEMEDRDEVHSNKKWYLFGKWRNEMPAENQRQELDPKAVHVINQVPVELDTSERPQELELNDVDDEQPPFQERDK
ncbi:uncharacterized protein N0V89_003544 [Didymosphaeria variabile]|uniref:Peptidase A1 domain-containing protein n=1 Tax=Didymosphaeria variabile TaxID=1932322 RepID=A0A9W9CCL9_9PLEO|nr:uncharacterized protein N0V89_003544 [Didymosphaeria variabile]KAJ4355527.1 hypothetical protein N0V89_003544 [Didymosphaeria variabile]